MEKESLITLKRQKELIAINKVLATLVVLFAFSSAYLLALQEQWFVKKTPVHQTQVVKPIVSQQLPIPVQQSPSSVLHNLLTKSRYRRTTDSKSVSKEAVLQLVFSAQGKITPWGERTVPSYKSAFPITLLAWIKNVPGIIPGMYVYDASNQSLVPYAAQATLSYPQNLPSLTSSPVILIASASAEMKYDLLTWNEAGGIAQNILLSATELDLITSLVPTPDPKDSTLWMMPISYDLEGK